MGRCHRRWELHLNQSVKPHHLPQQMIQKPLRRGRVSFLCTSAKTKTTCKHTQTHKLQHYKWEVSVSLSALALISRQRTTLPPFFYQDHLRIDRMLALLWLGPQKQSIWRFYLFIFLPISVTLGDVSISGSLLSPSSIDVKSLLASVKLNDRTANCTGLCFSHWFMFISAYLISPSWFYRLFYISFFVSFGFSSFNVRSTSVSASHLKIWHQI